MNLEKLKPWNWFKKEQEERREMPARSQGEELETGLLPILNLHRDVDRLFKNMLSATPIGMGGALELDTWPVRLPRMDISETDESYLLEVDVPGMKPEDIDITVDDGTLRIRGQRRREKSDSKYHKVERSYGFFERDVSLPADAEEEQIKAKFSDGVLKLTIQRNRQAENGARTITIEAE